MMNLVLPPLVRTAADARAFAWVAHRGQRDKAGRPYIGHVIGVHERFVDKLTALPEEQWEEAQQIAWLHDVIEDTPYTADDLLREGFSPNVVVAVGRFLTKAKSTPYAHWIERICYDADLATILVKLSDNEDNADPERLARLDDGTRAQLLAKYEPSMAMLRDAARARGWKG